MKKFFPYAVKGSFVAVLAALCFTLASAAPSTPARPLQVGIVNFKTCIEKSKLGKREQASLEAMKKQMQSILEEKAKSLNEMAAKFNDPDFLDTLSEEAEVKLKRDFRALDQELSQQQSQYYETFQQASLKVLQRLSEIIAKASKEVAKQDRLDLVINDEVTFFADEALNVSEKVVAKMDNLFDEEEKANPPKAQEQPKK